MIKTVVIVGGGTSGWLTALAVTHRIPNVGVILIDKEESTAVGVGEATLLGFDKFLNEYCGLNPQEWMPAVDAIPKAGILFPDWVEEGNSIWHPFYFPMADDKVPLWDAVSHTDEDIKGLLPLYDLSLDNKVDVADMKSYAWHIDCSKLVQYIQDHLKNTSILRHVQSSVVGKRVDAFNNIQSLVLADGSVVNGDIFFDCTGFKSILKEERDRVDLQGRLFVNTAVAGHVPYLEEGDCKCKGGTNSEKHPYVECPAVSDGWIWKIPLQTRIGSGMLFNRDITDVEDAKDAFVAYWDGRVDRDSLKIIDWTPYYDRDIWQNNVISIGLSAGFIEPLESTGVALITEGISKAVEIIKGRSFDSFDQDLYNSYMISLFETCADFVSSHYAISKKESDFWDYVRKNYTPSQYESVILSNINSVEPSITDGKPSIFGGSNWLYWLLQMGYPTQRKTYLAESAADYFVQRYKSYKQSLESGRSAISLPEFEEMMNGTN